MRCAFLHPRADDLRRGVIQVHRLRGRLPQAAGYASAPLDRLCVSSVIPDGGGDS